jgi:MFS transporter, ACS family, tartrate transporter
MFSAERMQDFLNAGEDTDTRVPYRASPFLGSKAQRTVLTRIQWRILPLLCCIFVLNYLDRVNIGFAALRMNSDIGLTPEIFGMGAGVLFAGYILLEIPAGLVMRRIGARRFLGAVVTTWGILSAGMALVTGTKSFLLIRFLIGLAEGGFLPCAILYIGSWFPQENRARAFSLFLVASTVAFIAGGPISGFLLSMAPHWGLVAWRWMFICEGMPTIVLGIFSLFYVTDNPADAKWLDKEQREWLLSKLRSETAIKSGISSLRRVFMDGRVWILAATFFLLNVGVTTLLFWLPQILKSASGRSDLFIGILSGIPFVGAACGLVFNARHSDTAGERVWHIIVASSIGSFGLLLCAFASSFWIGFVGICIGATGLWGAVGIFWTLPTSYLSDSAAAAGVPLINCVASLSGLVAPYAIGWLFMKTHTFSVALVIVAACVAFSSVTLKLLDFLRSLPQTSEIGKTVSH